MNGILPLPLKREVASCIYSIAQEALRNVAKHSKAKQASVILEATPSQVRLRIEDRGLGFPISLLKTASGLGVVIMKERARLAKGSFSITSKPGQGTQIIAEIPIGKVDS